MSNNLKGEIVEVTRGRKVSQGTVGIVFWHGTKFDRYAGHDIEKLGMLVLESPDLTTGEKVFCKAEYVEPVNAPQSLVDRATQLVEDDKRAFKASRSARTGTRYPTKHNTGIAPAPKMRPVGPPVAAFKPPEPEPEPEPVLTTEQLIESFAATLKELA